MTVAFVCLEYALEDNLPIYAGGLGVLAGDLILDTPPEDFQLVGLGIFYSHGFHAHHEGGHIDLLPFGWDLLKTNFSTRLGTDEVWFQVWKKQFNKSTVYLLDTNIPINKEEHRNITKHLYGPSQETMFDQQIILSFGIPKVLKFENISPDVYHLNEGHTAMTIIALAQGKPENLAKVKKICVGTKHTVLTGGGMHLKKPEFTQKLAFLENEQVNLDALFELGTSSVHPEDFSTTNFLMRYTRASNAVSVAHAKAEKQLHPHSHLIPITNGINKNRWQTSNLSDLRNLSDAGDLKLWEAHQKNKERMLEFLEKQTGTKLSLNTLTICWARRFVSYKRPDLLFKNVDELTKITSLFPSVQFIIAGQTNPADSEAEDIKDQIRRILEEKSLGGRICFLDNYNLEIAKFLVSGSDVWLNTPTPGVEASGTSGMKAGANGVLEFSTLDGWVSEVNWDGIGWMLQEANISQNLFKVLETEIFPLYYKVDQNGLPGEWIQRMRQTMKIIDDHYTTKRVLQDYLEKLYCSK